MMKTVLTCYAFLWAITAFAQNNLPRLELYAAPGFFIEGLNGDNLVPQKERNSHRIGDDVAYGIASTLQVHESRWVIKAGIGYRVRHYSLSKYSITDIFTNLFLFDAGPRRDTFAISRVKFTNKYVEVPLSIAFFLTRPGDGIGGISIGLTMRPGFLVSSNPQLSIDSSVRALPSPQATADLKRAYAQNATKTTLTVEPFFESSFFISNGVGILLQVRPFSIYSSRLNNRFTISTNEILGTTFGIMYDFNR